MNANPGSPSSAYADKNARIPRSDVGTRFQPQILFIDPIPSNSALVDPMSVEMLSVPHETIQIALLDLPILPLHLILAQLGDEALRRFSCCSIHARSAKRGLMDRIFNEVASLCMADLAARSATHVLLAADHDDRSTLMSIARQHCAHCVYGLPCLMGFQSHPDLDSLPIDFSMRLLVDFAAVGHLPGIQFVLRFKSSLVQHNLAQTPVTEDHYSAGEI